DCRVGFLPIGRKRGGFNPEWGGKMEEAARKAVESLSVEVVCPSEPVVDDSTLRRAVAEMKTENCDTLLVLQPTMGDGRLAPVLAQLWDEAVVFWATPEKQDDPRVSSCSLTGAHDFGAIFRQFDHPFELVNGHPEDEETRSQVLQTLRVSAATAKLHDATIGLVGGPAPGFVDMHADPAAMSRQLGVGLVQMGLRELHAAMDNVEESDIAEDAEFVKSWGLPMADGLEPDDVRGNSQYYLALKDMMEQRSLDALAVRCWPELPNEYGEWPYLAMARLLDEGRVVSLEGDTDAAIGCLLTQWCGMGPTFIADWLEHGDETITFWHPGQTPPSMCAPESLSLGMHFNINKPLVLNGRLFDGEPVTVYRIWRCDGEYRIAAAEGRSVPPRRELLGADITVDLEGVDPEESLEDLCHAGMPHHMGILYGCHCDAFDRLARQLDISWA
ncbi:MAG: L-fucose/L-arabinose isomerase family protein, partial [Planctomycetes bacterium]|nr:L-fucose/L-arabinose isomerase family protein [Planctomycetota bacterium]